MAESPTNKELDKLEQKMVATLIEDADRCQQDFDNVIEAIGDPKNLDAESYTEFEYRARALFRTLFASIEGLTFLLKVRTADWLIELGKELDEGEKAFIIERDYLLTDRGKVIKQKRKTRLIDSMRFFFALKERLHDLPPFDANVEWWSCLKTAIKVRDRLMHPKLVYDLDVKADELKAIMTAYHGFLTHLKSYPSVTFKSRRKTKRKLATKKIVQRRRAVKRKASTRPLKRLKK